MPDVVSTLHLIDQWKQIISELTSAFYQIALTRESMKFCNVAVPHRGTRVYDRSAMGIPGSETALKELMCRVILRRTWSCTGHAYGHLTPNRCVVFKFSIRKTQRHDIVDRGI